MFEEFNEEFTSLVVAQRDLARKERAILDDNRIDYLQMQSEIKKQTKFKNVASRVMGKEEKALSAEQQTLDAEVWCWSP